MADKYIYAVARIAGCDRAVDRPENICGLPSVLR